MNNNVINQRINVIVNDLFFDVIETDEVRDQKEELRNHLTDSVREYMEKGYDMEDSLAVAREGLGDREELVSGFEKKRAVEIDTFEDDYGVNIHWRMSRLFTRLMPLTPFIYIILGITQQHWQPEWWTWGWWTWGWIIIPMMGVLTGGLGWKTFTGLSPFIYILLGVFFGWWLWGWIIIPITGIIFAPGDIGRAKKRKKKSIVRVTKNGNVKIFSGDEHDDDVIIDVNMNGDVSFDKNHHN